jgi:hypothetical protein
MTHIDPFERITIQMFDVFIKMSETLGTANSRFFDTFFGKFISFQTKKVTEDFFPI